VAAAGPHDTAALRAQLAEAEASITQLHEQMQASSQLIKALAEQNAELVQRVESIRVRSWWLVGALALVGAIAGLNLAVTL
jgi:Spy/CpxP family protein refolding chaperone